MYNQGTEVNPTTAIIKVVVGELDWCNAIGLDGDGVLKNYSLAAPLFKEKFESVKDVSEVFIHNYADIAILKVAPSSFWFLLDSAAFDNVVQCQVDA